MRNTIFIVWCASLSVLLACADVHADPAFTTGKFGSGINTILENQGLTGLVTTTTDSEPLSTPEFSTTVQAAAVIQLSDILGMYELVSCQVSSGGSVYLRCSDYSFSGDMAITPHSTMWQRLSVAGLDTFVASGIFTLSNNTITAQNDLASGASVLQLTWDGQYLTTFQNLGSSNETDVWRRIMAPPTPCPTISDSDGDGVINQWDNCAGTPAGSCVDKNGCPVDIPRCINMTPIFNLFLDEDN